MFAWLFLAALAISLLALVYALIQELQHQKSSKFKRSSFFAPIPNRQRAKIISLLAGDEGAAIRLYRGIRRKHPGRTQQWCWEKALYDLKRDRNTI